MNFRLVLTMLSLLLITIAVTRLEARDSYVPDVCCGGPGDCDTGRCCDPEVLSLPDCDDIERPGYCRSACISGSAVE